MVEGKSELDDAEGAEVQRLRSGAGAGVRADDYARDRRVMRIESSH